MNNITNPNIIFILVDDMGWRDIGCYGSTYYETPNLDKLCTEGIYFTDAYAACPVCSPTRASIMSGKYPATLKVTDWIDHGTLHPCKGKLVDVEYVKQLPIEEKSLASALKDGGYSTWHVGKWHLGQKPYYPENHGFDVNIGGCSWGHPRNGYFAPYKIETLVEGKEGEYLTDRLTDEAINLIENSNDTPFFLNLWHYSVHSPIQAKQEDIEKFEIKAKNMGLNEIQPFIEGENFPCSHKKYHKVIRRIVQSNPIYAAMIYNLDFNIGRLLRCLDESGKTHNTIIIFTSDNGGLATAEGSPTCNAPLSEGKGWMYEGGVREPLIIKWPNVVIPGSICSVPVTSPDFYPTILDMAGLQKLPDQHIDGESMLMLLNGQGKQSREAIYWHYPHYGNQGGTPGSSIRMGDYKLIEFFEDGHLELYNLKYDLMEKQNLTAEMPELCQIMYTLLSNWRRKILARIPQKNMDYADINTN